MRGTGGARRDQDSLCAPLRLAALAGRQPRGRGGGAGEGGAALSGWGGVAAAGKVTWPLG